MSIIIKGMDMPISGSIVVEILPNGKVFPHTKGISFHHEAIEIPTPHGRLIDADKARAEFREWAEDEWNQNASPVSWAYAYEDVIDYLDDAPTILESEE